MSSTHLRRSHRCATAVLALSVVCLSACSSPSAAPQEQPGTPESSAVSQAPPPQTLDLGAKAALSSDTITVSRFLDAAAPKAAKPETPSTHWASATVRQCATAASRQGDWALTLADGTTAPEATSWIEGDLPHQLQPSDEPLAAGDCVSGDVYFVVPDGARTTGVVLEPRAGSPVRPQVTWTVA